MSDLLAPIRALNAALGKAFAGDPAGALKAHRAALPIVQQLCAGAESAYREGYLGGRTSSNNVDADWLNSQARAGAPLACTCPSGDGSLRWPCPTHPSDSPGRVDTARRMAAVEALQAEGYTWDGKAWAKPAAACSWCGGDTGATCHLCRHHEQPAAAGDLPEAVACVVQHRDGAIERLEFLDGATIPVGRTLLYTADQLRAAVAGYRRDAEALAASWRNWNCRADMGWREAVALCADSLELHAALANLGSGDHG